MARHSASGYGGLPRRSTFRGSKSSYSKSTPSSSGPVQPSSLPRGNTAGRLESAAGYAPSNVTGYRKQLHVEGLPGSDHFISRDSHRRAPSSAESRGRRYRASDRGSAGIQYIGRKDSVTGKELVKYTSYQAEGEDEDTVVPEDSISNASSRRSRRSRDSESRRHSRRSDGHWDDRGEAEHWQGRRNGDQRSVFEGIREYDAEHGYYVVERRPRREYA